MGGGRVGVSLVMVVDRSPADRIPSHGTDLLGQRYAYDLVPTDHRPGVPCAPRRDPALVAGWGCGVRK